MNNKTTRFFVFSLVVMLHAALLGTLILTSQTIHMPEAQLSEPSISGVLVSPSPVHTTTSKPQQEEPTQPTKPKKLKPSAQTQHATPVAKDTPQTNKSTPSPSTPPAAPSPSPTSEPAQRTVNESTEHNATASAQRITDSTKQEEPTTTPPRTDAAHLNNPAPTYPAISRRLGEQGKVLLNVYILPDGSVEQLNIKTSSGHPRLDEAAMNAVKRWKYVPAKRGDQAIAFWYVQPISFVLNSN